MMRVPPRFAFWASSSLAMILSCAQGAVAAQHLFVVVGAPGTDEYATQFADWVKKWQEAARRGGAEFTLIGSDGPASDAEAATTPNDRTRLKQLLDEQAAQRGDDAAWLVLIGHGTFDGETAKLNLRGADVTLKELGEWLAPIPATVAVIDCTSASAPLIGAVPGPNRVVITATKSGHELNFARFGLHIAEAIGSRDADLDKDDQTSLLEAYVVASRRVAEFYDNDARLATEHALLDDNGDGLGTPATWFRGLRATKRAKEGASLDGLRAHQLHLIRSERELQLSSESRERRDAIERELAVLRDRKSTMDDAAYYAQLEPLLVELSRLYALAR